MWEEARVRLRPGTRELASKRHGAGLMEQQCGQEARVRAQLCPDSWGAPAPHFLDPGSWNPYLTKRDNTSSTTSLTSICYMGSFLQTKEAMTLGFVGSK